MKIDTNKNGKNKESSFKNIEKKIQDLDIIKQDIINEIESRVQKLDSVTEMLEQGMAPADMLDAVLGNLDLQILDESTPVYHCGCSKERMERALLSLGRKDLQSLYDDGKEVEMCCQFCDGKYMFSHEEVGELLQR